jgi:cytochrome c oxidase cbb3-type subunit 1
VSPPVANAVRRHSLGWLVAANLVGLLLATLLLWPELNDLLAPLTYGRWVPLHLDWQLYGWCALPLVGVLLRYYLPDDARGAFAARLTLWIWTGALLYGGIAWLGGRSSGKLFLDWTGRPRFVWSVALLVLWLVLFTQTRRRGPNPWWARGLLLGLAVVPFVIYWAAGAGIYPAVNPNSGGATGASLLGSTLGVMVIVGLLPLLLRLEHAPGPHAGRAFAVGLALTLSYFAGIEHGNASNHRPDQILGLAILLLWIPLVWIYVRSFMWTPVSQRWLGAAFVWWLLLVVTGLLMFLPGLSEQLKFTNALVAHSHLAMAGLVTSLHVAILLNLGPGRAPRAPTFWAWQAGCAVQVAALFWLGWHEGLEPALLYVRGGMADWCYGLRLAAGLLMFAASFLWLCDMGRKTHDPQET